MGEISKELIERVLTAKSESKPLMIVGSNSKSFFGRTVVNEEQLDMTAHKGIITYEPTELVITARSGTSIKDIKAALAEQGQSCPFEPALFAGQATLGGTLACNFSGPARPWRGSIRDAVLGTRLINGKGEHLKFGGQVMKNVAGYDVSRLQAGALGTLGAITEISMKVLPIAKVSTTVVKEITADEALTLMNSVSAKPYPVTGSTWMDGKLYLRFEGAARAVESAVSKLGGEVLEQAAEFWESLTEQSLDFFQTDEPLWRFSLNSNAAHFSADNNWLLDWGGAQRWLRGHFEQQEMEQLASNAGGHVSLFRNGDRSGDVFHTPSALQQKIQKDLKAAFDPDRIFNPGRLYSWL